MLGGLLLVAFGATSRAQEPTPAAAAGDPALQEVVVTGVFYKSALENAPIAITALDADAIKAQIPNSAADLLKNVPGVFVNSSLGEIRNVVYSRGVSASSLDGASGYYYVSLQEDGLPVSNVTFNNFGPDYFYRHAVGARDAGYPLNRGGQFKGNLQYTYDSGAITPIISSTSITSSTGIQVR